MKFPWRRRADEEATHRVAAEQRQADAEADWPEVISQAASLQRERNLNGWTENLRALYGYQHRKAGS